MSENEKVFRNILGRFATGVCVVSTLNSNAEPVAMTINSFTSVSLNPSLILWSLKKDSFCYSIFLKAQEYSVSVLSSEQIAISNKYAKIGDHIMDRDDYAISSRGIPYIKDSMANFECSHWDVHSAGDHDILVAEVIEFGSTVVDNPLIFYGGQYRGLSIGF